MFESANSSWMLSSAGRASPLHGGGRGFEPLSIHHNAQKPNSGRVAKWLNAADCKSVTSGFGSSNLPPPTIKVYWGVAKR